MTIFLLSSCLYVAHSHLLSICYDLNARFTNSSLSYEDKNILEYLLFVVVDISIEHFTIDIEQERKTPCFMRFCIHKMYIHLFMLKTN